KLKLQKALSRSERVQMMVVDWAELVKRGEADLDTYVDLGDLEEGSAADTKRRAEVRNQFSEVTVVQKKTQQTADKLETVAVSNKKLRRKWNWKWNRARVEMSKSIRALPWHMSKWKEFTKEIEHTIEELSHLDAELKRLEERPALNQGRIRELK